MEVKKRSTFKIYTDAHPEYLIKHYEKLKQRETCELCGCSYSKVNRRIHLKSKKHNHIMTSGGGLCIDKLNIDQLKQLLKKIIN